METGERFPFVASKRDSDSSVPSWECPVLWVLSSTIRNASALQQLLNRYGWFSRSYLNIIHLAHSSSVAVVESAQDRVKLDRFLCYAKPHLPVTKLHRNLFT